MREILMRDSRWGNMLLMQVGVCAAHNVPGFKAWHISGLQILRSVVVKKIDATIVGASWHAPVRAHATPAGDRHSCNTRTGALWMLSESYERYATRAFAHASSFASIVTRAFNTLETGHPAFA